MANRYWVGGIATWDATAGTKWSTTSGGVSGAAVPTAADDVFFDAASGANTVTFSTSTVARSINCTGFTGTLSHPASTTVDIGDGTAGAGNVAFKLVSGMAGYTIGNALSSEIRFVSSSATQQTIDSGGKTMPTITFNNSSGSWILAASLTQSTAAVFTLGGGALSTNSLNHQFGVFVSSNSNVRSLTLGSSTITIQNSSATTVVWNVATSTNMTLSAGTSTIILRSSGSNPNFSGGGLTYYDVSFTQSNGGCVVGTTGTFHNLSCDNTVIGGGNRPLSIAANITVNGIFTYIGNNSGDSRGFLSTSLTRGIAVTIALGATGSAVLTNIDVRDFAFTGTAAPVSGTSVADFGGNSGITFTTIVTRYWVGGTGSMSDTTHWAATSGGASGASVPTVQDTCIFDANSFSAGSQVVSENLMRVGPINFTGATNSPTLRFLNPNGASNTVYGDLTLITAMSVDAVGAAGGASTVVFEGRGAQTFTPGPAWGINIATNFFSAGGTYTLQGNLTTANNSFNLNQGTFNANNFNITCSGVSASASNTRTLIMGSGTWTLGGTGNVWNLNTFTGMTLTPGTSTIVVSDTSATAKSILPGTSGSPALNNLTITGGGTGSVTINSAVTINNLTITGPKSIIMQAGQTKTITGSFAVTGTSGNLVTFTSSTPGSTYTFSKASGGVTADYVSLTDSIATGGASWYAGGNSTNGGNNTGWIFPVIAVPAGGNWSATGTWVGGVVPTASTYVALAASSGNVTIDAAAACRSFNCTGYVGTLAHTGGMTLAVGDATVGAGTVALKLVAGMTYTGSSTGNWTFISTSATQQSIDYASKTGIGSVTVNGAGSSYIMQGAMTQNSGAAGFTLTTGTLNTNGFTMGWSGFSSSNSNTRTLTLGASTVNLLGTSGTIWNFSTQTNLTFNAGTSNITWVNNSLTLQLGTGLTYYDLTIPGGTSTISGATATFHNVTCAPAAGTGALILVGGNWTGNLLNLTFTDTGTVSTQAWFTNGTLPVATTPRTMTFASVSLQNISFSDVIAAGASIPWTGTNLGDALGNSNITFPASRTLYWVGVAAAWTLLAKWSLTSGGATGNHAPLPHDDVIMDANSGIGAAAQFGVDRIMGRNIDMSAANVNTFGWNNGLSPACIFGSLSLRAGSTIAAGAGQFAFNGRGSHTITSNGVSFANTGGVRFNGQATGSYTLTDNFVAASQITFDTGVLTFNANVTTTILNSQNTNTRTMNMGSGTTTVTGTGVVFNFATVTGLTFSGANATVVVSDTSATSKTIEHRQTTNKLGTLSFTGGGNANIIMPGSSAYIGNIILGPNQKYIFNGPTGLKFDTMSTTATAGNLSTIVAGAGGVETAGTATTITKQTAGSVVMDYISLKDSTGAGTGAFYYGGANSTNVSGNTNWIFGAIFTATKTQTGISRIAKTVTKTQPAIASIIGNVSTLYDDFNDNSTDAKWNVLNSGGTFVQETGQELRITSDKTIVFLAGYRSASPYAMGSGRATIRAFGPGAFAAAYETWLMMYIDANNYFGWVFNNGNMIARSVVAGVTTNHFTVSFNSTNHRFWSVAMSGSNVTFDMSADPNTGWNTLSTQALGYTSTQFNTIYPSLLSGTNAITATSPSTVQLDNFNVYSFTKTQTAIARIIKTVTKTQPATAAILGTATKTQLAKARISQGYTKTQSAISRISRTVTKTQTATARIQRALTKTQTAISRVAKNFTKTQSATASLVQTYSKTQTAVARIVQNLTKTQTAIARIVATRTKTQTAIARIALSKTKTQTAVSRIRNIVTKTQTAKANIVQNIDIQTKPVLYVKNNPSAGTVINAKPTATTRTQRPYRLT